MSQASRSNCRSAAGVPQKSVAGSYADILIGRDPMEERISITLGTSSLREGTFPMVGNVASRLVDSPTPGKVSGEL